MNTIFAVGCSFTSGLDTFEKYEFTSFEKDCHWLPTLTKLLAEDGRHYKWVNKGQGGIGMKGILYHLLNILPIVKSGDMLILGSTYFDRMSFIEDVDESKFNQVVITPDSARQYLEGTGRDILRKQSKPYNDLLYTYYVENSFMCSDDGFNYLHTEGIFLQRAFRNMCELLEAKGVTCYRWGNDIWFGENFELIEQWTEGYVDDGHWSPNGNTAAGRFFYWCIKNGYKNFSSQYLEKCLTPYKKLWHWSTGEILNYQEFFDIHDFKYQKFKNPKPII